MIRCAFVLAMAFGLTATALQAADEENPVVKLVKSKVKDPSKPFAMFVTLKVKPGNEKAFEAAFTPALAATHKEPGSVAYELNRDAESPNVYVMYEQFKSLAAVEEHAKTEYVKKLLDTIVPMLEGPPEVRVFTVPGK